MKVKTVVPLVRLTVTENDGKVVRVASRRKKRVLSKIVRGTASEWKLEVVYMTAVSNSGTFTDKSIALQALSNWTSQDLLDFVSDGEW